MNSRRFGLPSLVVAVCVEMGSALMAQDSRINVDPIIGTWELNLVETKILQGAPPISASGTLMPSG